MVGITHLLCQGRDIKYRKEVSKMRKKFYYRKVKGKKGKVRCKMPR